MVETTNGADTPESGADALDDTRTQLALATKALSVMRHDVRNLLASVTILASRMEESGDERLAKAAPMLVASMERVVNLGVRAGHLAETSRGTPVSTAVADALPDEVQCDADASVIADPGQLRTILAELIDNVRYLNAEPLITVTKKADMVVISVADDGPGIPDYGQADLFTPFKGTKRRDGAGIGLPLAARLAALNNGDLTLARTGDEGTEFQLTLPAA